MKKYLFYLLTFTWGLPITLIGGLVAMVLTAIGYESYGKYGYCWVFKVGQNWGGLSLGPVIITSTPSNLNLMKHEHGHAIQNCWFGPLFPIVIALPSAIRYWWREILIRNGKTDLPSYDSIWFEGQATRLGTEFIRKHFGG